jgi:murein DD-endopeptidase MepM/ murein hydrolase activator NlpD
MLGSASTERGDGHVPAVLGRQDELMSRRSLLRWCTVTALTIASPAAASAVVPDASTRIVAIAARAHPGEARWPWPIAPPIVVARPFVAPATPYAAGHRGIDLAVGTGTEVRSSADGIVSFAGVVVDRPVLTIDVGDDLLVSFEPLDPAVTRGDGVARGQVIGRVATGGHCAGSCVHVSVRLHGAYLSPLLFFDRVPRAVLLPLH